MIILTYASVFRFLIARNHDYEKAMDMMRAHLVWRANNMPVTKASCLNEFSKGKLFMHGNDYHNMQIMLIHFI